MRVDIPAPALSWSPSGMESLQTGESYIWYVKAFDSNGEGEWSIGNRFRIDASVALNGMDEAVKEKVREYVRSDKDIRDAVRDIKAEEEKLAIAGGRSEKHTFKGTEGDTNTFYGQDAGNVTMTGNSNTFIGVGAGHSNTTGCCNAFMGALAGSFNNTGSYNVFMGDSTGYFNISGNCNTFMGLAAGWKNTSGSGNVFLGYMAGFNETGSNRLYINNDTSSNPLIYGEFDNRLVKVNGTLNATGVLSISDISLKKDVQALEGSLEKIANLNGVSYNWCTEEYPEKGFSRDRQIGLIAQDVEKVLPELVRTDQDGKKSVSYDKLTAVLVEAIKAQQSEIREQNSRLSAQSEEIENQKARLSEQQSEMAAGKSMLAATKAEIEELRRLVRQITSRNL